MQVGSQRFYSPAVALSQTAPLLESYCGTELLGIVGDVEPREFTQEAISRAFLLAHKILLHHLKSIDSPSQKEWFSSPGKTL